MADAAGEIEGYTFVSELGRGGFGTVHRATDHQHGRDVAVKVLGRLDDEGARRRFDRERRAMGTLSGHPNIAIVYNSGFSDDGKPFIAMELLTGGSLSDMLEERGRFDVDEVVDIGTQLCDALAHAHAGGVLHLDMKPENVLFSAFGNVKIVDFGIAALVDDQRTSSIFATPAYADPVVLDGTPGTDSSDVYGLAATLYTLLDGDPPYQSTSGALGTFARIANDPVPRVERSDVPAPIADCLRKAMSKDPSDRPGSMVEFRAELLAAAAQVARPSTPSPTPTVTPTVVPTVAAAPRPADPGPADPGPAAPAPTTTNQPPRAPASRPPPPSSGKRNRSTLVGVSLFVVAGLLLGVFAAIAFTRNTDDGGSAGAVQPGDTAPADAVPDVAEPAAPESSDPVVVQPTTPDTSPSTTAGAAAPIDPAPNPSATSAQNPRFSLQTTNGLPDPEVFVIPEDASQLCLTWQYAGFPSGASFQTEWLLDGIVDESSRFAGTNAGAEQGEFFGCFTSSTALLPGRYELRWIVSGEQVFTHGIHVGGGRTAVTIGIQNDRSTAVCGVFWAPIGSVTEGLAANSVAVEAGERFETTLPTGRYRTLVRDCTGAVVFEAGDTEFTGDLTLTVVDE